MFVNEFNNGNNLAEMIQSTFIMQLFYNISMNIDVNSMYGESGKTCNRIELWNFTLVSLSNLKGYELYTLMNFTLL